MMYAVATAAEGALVVGVTSVEVVPSIATQCKYNGGGIVKFVLCPDNCNMEEV